MNEEKQIFINRAIKPIIFVGSSLPQTEVRQNLKIDADIRAPIMRNNLLSLDRDTQVVVIIDGVFGLNRAVAPFEILDLLKKNIIVYGASSMGAMRAAELDVYGMRGVGEIYRMYKTEEITADAEVSLIFDPITYKPITQPLVNIRYAFRKIRESGLITKDDEVRVIEVAQDIYFSNLTYNYLFEKISPFIEKDIIERIKEYVSYNGVKLDLKRKDALEVIDTINILYLL